MYLSVEHYANTIYVVEICVAKLLGKQEGGTKWMHPRKTITVRDINCLTVSRKPPTQRHHILVLVVLLMSRECSRETVHKYAQSHQSIRCLHYTK